MTDEQIIQRAREAGMTGEATPAVIEFVRNLLEAEIEACAKICEEVGDKDDTFYREESRASDCAYAIRARKSL